MSRPTAPELIEAVAEFLAESAGPETDGRTAFHAKVAANVLRIVQRELDAPPGRDHAWREHTATAIRDGAEIDDSLWRDVIADVLHRIAIDNPRYPSLAEARDRWAGDLSR